jgi:hypothetical protein
VLRHAAVEVRVKVTGCFAEGAGSRPVPHTVEHSDDGVELERQRADDGDLEVVLDEGASVSIALGHTR